MCVGGVELERGLGGWVGGRLGVGGLGGWVGKGGVGLGWGGGWGQVVLGGWVGEGVRLGKGAKGRVALILTVGRRGHCNEHQAEQAQLLPLSKDKRTSDT